VVAILREGHVVIPQPETVLAEGDEVLALAAPESERQLRNAIIGEGMPGSTPSDDTGGVGSI
jgi:Trk K+ transport system NAD-binding subunit